MAYTFVHKLTKDGALESYGVESIREMKQYLNDGWVRDPKDLTNEANKTKTNEKEVKEERDPIREELKAKAEELGITFRNNISTDNLLKKIKNFLGE